MKKITSLLIALLLSLSGYAQLNNLPSDLGTIQAYKENSLDIPIQIDAAWTIPTPVTAELRDGVGINPPKLTSITPTVTVVGHLVTVKLTAAQMTRLTPGNSYSYRVKFNGVAKLGGIIRPQLGTGTPSTTPYVVSLPDIGVVKIQLIGDAAAAAQYRDQARAAKDSLSGIVNNNQWTGKKIIWVGTSIPWQYQPNSYPEQIARKLGATIYNNSISGSSITYFPPASGFAGKPGMSGTFTENIAASAGQNNSYQYTINYFLSTFGADLLVIDHGTNDVPYMPDSLGDINSTRKSLLYGAYNHIITNVLTTYPNLKIVLCTPPNRYTYGGTTQTAKYEAVAGAIKALGKKWSLPVLDWGELGGINILTSPTGKFTTDGLHPTSTYTNNVMVPIGYRFLLQVR